MGLTKVTCLIKAHVVIAKDLKLCTENLSRKCGLQRVPGHILWCKANGLRVAVPEWLRHDALGSLDVQGLTIKFNTVGSKKLGIYVNKSVSRSSTEFRSLDHAMSFPGSKWELLATTVECNDRLKKKKQGEVSHCKTEADIAKLIESSASVARTRSSRGTFAKKRGLAEVGA